MKIVHPFHDARSDRSDDELSEEEGWFAERTREPVHGPIVWSEHRRSA